jgi:sugar phosphate isomerase/epimerase
MKLTRRQLCKHALLSGVAIPMFGGQTPFKLGIITDELTDKLDEALPFLTKYHLHWAELRDMWGKNIMNSPKEDLHHAKKLLDDAGIKVSDIGSPIFKWNLPQMPAKANEKRDEDKANFIESDAGHVMEKSFELAHFFGTNKVRIFSYWRVKEPEKAYPYVRDRLGEAAQVAAKNGMVLVLENEHSCNIGTGRELGRLLKDVNSPGLRGNWDPGNAAMLDEVPYPHGYETVKGLFAHMHIKDVRLNATTRKKEWAPVGGGIIDWKGQIQALRKDGYDGTMSLETHYRRADGNKVESSRESLEGLLKIIG